MENNRQNTGQMIQPTQQPMAQSVQPTQSVQETMVSNQTLQSTQQPMAQHTQTSQFIQQPMAQHTQTSQPIQQPMAQPTQPMEQPAQQQSAVQPVQPPQSVQQPMITNQTLQSTQTPQATQQQQHMTQPVQQPMAQLTQTPQPAKQCFNGDTLTLKDKEMCVEEVLKWVRVWNRHKKEKYAFSSSLFAIGLFLICGLFNILSSTKYAIAVAVGALLIGLGMYIYTTN